MGRAVVGIVVTTVEVGGVLVAGGCRAEGTCEGRRGVLIEGAEVPAEEGMVLAEGTIVCTEDVPLRLALACRR